MNAALLRLRLATFGNTMRAYLDCPECGSRLEFALDGATLLALRPDEPAFVVVDGRTFRAPTSRDLAAILEESSDERAARRLLRRCALDADELSDSALEMLLDSVGAALEQADTLTDVTLELHCRACDHEWTAAFDIGGFLWEEIEAYVARLIDEVHVLASAYGWSESTILSLSDSRRAVYLERVRT
jgi:hypothetical protein